MNHAGTLVTRVKNVREHHVRSFVTLEQVYNEIKDNPENHQFHMARCYYLSGDKTLYNNFRNNIPAFYFTGQFSVGNESCKPSGLLCLDFDKCDKSVKDAMASDPNAVLAFTSPSGNGLKVIVSVACAFDPASSGQWKVIYDSVAEIYRDRYGVTACTGSRGFSHACYLAHDPASHWNPAAAPLHPLGSDKLHGLQYASCATLDTPPHELTLSALVEATYVRTKGERNRKLGIFARGLIFNCGFSRENKAELRQAFELWYNRSLSNMETKSKDENLAEFYSWTDVVRKPLNSGSNRLEMAWDMVLKENYPIESWKYDTEPVRKLVALCYHLKDDSDRFFLSSHTVATMIGCEPRQAYRYLNMLCCEGILVCEKKGVMRKSASAYVWFGRPK